MLSLFLQNKKDINWDSTKDVLVETNRQIKEEKRQTSFYKIASKCEEKAPFVVGGSTILAGMLVSPHLKEAGIVISLLGILKHLSGVNMSKIKLTKHEDRLKKLHEFKESWIEHIAQPSSLEKDKLMTYRANHFLEQGMKPKTKYNQYIESYVFD